MRVAAGVCIGVISSSLWAQTSDVAVRALVQEYEASIKELGDSATRSDYDDLREDALETASIPTMSPAQLALLYRHGLLVYEDARDQAAERLHVFEGDRTTVGASAAVLRLELEASPFVWFSRGVRHEFKPDPKARAERLQAALSHPALIAAARAGDPAAAHIASAGYGLDAPQLWDKHREQILALDQIYSSESHPRVFSDVDDHAALLKSLTGEPAKVDELHRRVIAAAGAIDRTPQEDRFPLSDEDLEWVRLAVARAGAALEGDLVGRAAPSLEFLWCSTGEKGLDDFAGRVIVLDFWATWCAPCIASFPQIARLNDFYADSPVTILGVTSLQGRVPLPGGMVQCAGNPDAEFRALGEFARLREMHWSVVVTGQNVYNPDYRIRGIPHMVVIGPDGVVSARGLHPADGVEDVAGVINSVLEAAGIPAPSLDALD